MQAICKVSATTYFQPFVLPWVKEHAPEVSVTKKHFNIFNSLAANAAEHIILIEASA